MKLYIENYNEIELVKKIKELNPEVKIINSICDYIPINDYPDSICDNCFNYENEKCLVQQERL